MTKLVGWLVKATVDGKHKYVSAPLATEAAAIVYRDLYLKEYPESGAYVEQKVIEDRL